MQYFFIALILIAIYITFAIGQKFPSPKTQEKIQLTWIKENLAHWYGRIDWKCLQIIENYPGPIGSTMRVAILFSGHHQVIICDNYSKIITGKAVKLRMREADESPSVWVSVADKFMIPV